MNIYSNRELTMAVESEKELKLKDWNEEALQSIGEAMNEVWEELPEETKKILLDMVEKWKGHNIKHFGKPFLSEGDL